MTSLGGQNPKVRLSDDHIARTPVIAVAVVGGFIFLLAIWVAWLMLRIEQPAAVQVAPTTVYMGREPRQISGIEQRPFKEGGAALDSWGRDRQILNSYGWVDQGQGLIHIPVQDAIEWLATE